LLRRIRHRAARVMEPVGPPGNSFDRLRASRAWSGCLQTETPSFAEGAEETGRSTAVVCQVLRMSVSDRRCFHSMQPRRECGVNRRLAAAAILWSGAEGHGRLICMRLAARRSRSRSRDLKAGPRFNYRGGTAKREGSTHTARRSTERLRSPGEPQERSCRPWRHVRRSCCMRSLRRGDRIAHPRQSGRASCRARV